MTKFRTIFRFFISIAILSMVTQGVDAKISKIIKTKTKTEDGDADRKMEAELGEYKGLKHALAVVDFENQAGWVSNYKLGYNLAIMLESALYDSGRFVLVERQNLDAVLVEQDLQKSGRMAGAGNVAQSGKLRSARYLASGAITEVEANQSGDDGGIRIRGFKIGASGGKAQITAIVKLIDTTTGEVVAKQRVVGKAGKGGLRVGYSSGVWGANLGGFTKTPIGEAAQDVIVQSVLFFANEMEDYDFTASVVTVAKGGEIIINRGSTYGVFPGQHFLVEEEGEQLIDPDTGEILGESEGEQLIDPDTGEILGESEGEMVAQIRCLRVKEKIAYCELTEGSIPARGSVVRAAR